MVRQNGVASGHGTAFETGQKETDHRAKESGTGTGPGPGPGASQGTNERPIYGTNF